MKVLRNRILMPAAEKINMRNSKSSTLVKQVPVSETTSALKEKPMAGSFFALKKRLVESLAFAVGVAIILQAPFIDILILKNTITEISVTELLQVSILTVIAGIFIYLSRHHPIRETKYGMILIAGFFACAVIRELDFITDQLSVSWFHFVLAIVFYMLFLAWRHRNMLYGVAHFCKSESYYIMVCGLLTVFVFSRLMGMSMLWQNLLNESYLRVVKNAVEEGAELFGYTLCLLSALRYAVSLSGSKIR